MKLAHEESVSVAPPTIGFEADRMAFATTSTMTAAPGATTSMMSIRQAIAGPRPPQSYAGLCKAVLRYRQKRVFGLAFAGIAILFPIAAYPVVGNGQSPEHRGFPAKHLAYIFKWYRNAASASLSNHMALHSDWLPGDAANLRSKEAIFEQ